MPARLLRKFFQFLMTALLVLTAVPLHAHDSTLGGSKWCFGKNRILVAIELGASLFPEIRGLREGGYDLDSLSDEQLKTITADVIQPYITQKLSVSVNDKAHPARVSKVVLEGSLWRIWLSLEDIGFNRAENRVKIDYRLLFEETGNAHVNLAYMYQSDASADAVQKVFDYSHPVGQHAFDANAQIWEVSVKGISEPAAASEPASPAAGASSNESDTPTASGQKTMVATTAEKNAIDPLSAEGLKTVPVSGNPAADGTENSQGAPAYAINSANKSSWSNIGQFIVLGIEHILIGYDHIAFLLALIVIGLSVREVLKIITAFTVAHSITLLLAALQIVSLNSRLVESVIALSICYVALENLFKKEVNYRWLVTFGFGLIHGFGFASVLQDFIVGKSDLVLSVLSFNVGVEIGQLMIFLVMLPILHMLKNKMEFRIVTAGASVATFVLGFAWLIERVFNLELLSF